MPADRRRPTIYLSNWSSARTPGHHGPGRKLTIMAAPRRWEHGAGPVPQLTPEESDVRAAKSGAMSVEMYREVYEQRLRGEDLRPGPLWTRTDDWQESVRDGDTLCCACSRDAAAAGRCHRVWAAPALVRAGWRVILDGVEVSDAG